MDTILNAENLVYSYEDAPEPSLNGLTLSIPEGSRVALMGENGSGKSTFFLCCNGIFKPQKGRLAFRGVPFSYDRRSLLELRRQVGIVFQNPDVQLFSASVYEDISFGLLNLGLSETEAAERVGRVMEELEITPFRDRPVHALSGGQKKQVSLAGILVMEPALLILDEPFTSLDARHKERMKQQIYRLSDSGRTVLTATHDPDFALEWADRVILLKKGRTLAQGEAAAILSSRRLLEEAGLPAPSVLPLFETLKRKGILAEHLPLPRSLAALERCLH